MTSAAKRKLALLNVRWKSRSRSRRFKEWCERHSVVEINPHDIDGALPEWAETPEGQFICGSVTSPEQIEIQDGGPFSPFLVGSINLRATH